MGIRRGSDAFLKTGNNEANGDSIEFLSVEPGQTIEVVPMASLENPDYALKVFQHSKWNNNKPVVVHICIGERNDCPGCAVGVSGSTRYFLPVIEGAGLPDEAVRIWGFGVTIKDQLVTYYQDMGAEVFVGSVFNLKRIGAGKETRWQVWPTGRRVDLSGYGEDEMPDIDSRLGPLDKEGIERMYSKANFGGYSDNGDANGTPEETEEEAEAEGGWANIAA